LGEFHPLKGGVSTMVVILPIPYPIPDGAVFSF
jgi:hypothetical protein